MTPGAAREINAYRGALRTYEEGGREPTQADQQEMLRIHGEIARLLEAPSSWSALRAVDALGQRAARVRKASRAQRLVRLIAVEHMKELSALSAPA